MYDFGAYVPLIETCFGGQLPHSHLAHRFLKDFLEYYPQVNPKTTLMALDKRHRTSFYPIHYPMSSDRWQISVHWEPGKTLVPEMTFIGWIRRRLNRFVGISGGWEIRLVEPSTVYASGLTEKIKIEEWGLRVSAGFNEETNSFLEGGLNFFWAFGYSSSEDILVYKIIELGEYVYSR